MGDNVTTTNIATGNATVGVQVGGSGYGSCPNCQHIKNLTSVVQVNGKWILVCDECVAD